MMAMEERVAGIVRYEIDLRRRETGQTDRVFDDARGRLVADLCDLEAVALGDRPLRGSLLNARRIRG